jgi:hypothetical protein
MLLMLGGEISVADDKDGDNDNDNNDNDDENKDKIKKLQQLQQP